MKRTLLLLSIIFFLTATSAAQELLLEYPTEEALLLFPSAEALKEEISTVNLKAGENTFHLSLPSFLTPQDLQIDLQGGRLKGITYQGRETTVSIEAEQSGPGKIRLLYPARTTTVNFRYQVVLEKGRPIPEVSILAELQEEKLTYRNAKLRFLDREFSLELAPGERKTLSLVTFSPEWVRKTIEYRDGEGKLFLALKLPARFLLPARVEYFEKQGNLVTFLGEGTFTPQGTILKLPLGKSEDLLVQEAVTLREKQNRVFGANGEEVLYDTREEKRYHLENRGEEEKEVVIFQRVQPSFRLLESTVPVKREDLETISLTVTLGPQEEKELTIRIEGQKLTSGWILEE